MIPIKIPDSPLQYLQDAGLQDFMDYVQILLNGGRYEMRVISEVPTWAANEGEALLYASGSDRRVYYYINGIWCYAAFAITGNISKIVDGDTDTWIDVETSADEDKIRMATANIQRVVVDSTGLEVISGDLAVTTGLKVNLEGTGGGSYFKYNSGTSYTEIWSNGEKRIEL